MHPDNRDMCVPGTAGLRRLALCCLALLLAGGANVTRAQDSVRAPLRVTVAPGYQLGAATAAIPVFAGSADCGQFTSGTSSATAFGVSIALPSVLSDRFGLGIHFGWMTATTRLAQFANEPIYVYTASSSDRLGHARRVDHEYRLSGSWNMLTCDLFAQWRFGTALSIAAGPWAGNRFGATVASTEALVNEPEFRFTGGRVEQAFHDGPAIHPRTLSYGVGANLTYLLPLSAQVHLVPELAFRADLASAVEDYSWRTYSVALNLGVAFDFGPASTTPLPPIVVHDTTVLQTTQTVDRPAKSTRLRASLDLYGVDESSRRLPAATIHVHEVLYRQRVALLESIYFDKNSAELPERYVALSTTAVAGFSTDSLFGLDPLTLHRQALNLIGDRMRKHPEAILTVAGSISKGERASLAEARARAIRRYLMDVWRIDSQRVVVATAPAPGVRESGEDQRAENRRVALTSSSPAILDPVIGSQLRRDFDPPLIALNPQFESDAGIKKWSVDLVHEGKLVGRLSNSDTSADGKIEMKWQIDDDGTSLASSFLAAELTVEDSAGVIAATRTQVPLVIARDLRVVDRLEQQRGRETITYSLLDFARGSIELVGRNLDVVAEAAANMRPGARVTVVGYADRTGNDGRNVELSRRRADAVAHALRGIIRDRGLRGVQISVAGEGYAAGRVDNEHPEGRAMSREVEIIVEQGS